MYRFIGDKIGRACVTGVEPREYSDKEFDEVSASYSARNQFESGALERSGLFEHVSAKEPKQTKSKTSPQVEPELDDELDDEEVD